MSYWDKALLVGLGVVLLAVGLESVSGGFYSAGPAFTFAGAAMTALGAFQGIQVAIRRAHVDVAEEREDGPVNG